MADGENKTVWWRRGWRGLADGTRRTIGLTQEPNHNRRGQHSPRMMRQWLAILLAIAGALVFEWVLFGLLTGVVAGDPDWGWPWHQLAVLTADGDSLIQPALALLTPPIAIVTATFAYRRSAINLAESQRADVAAFQQRFIDAAKLLADPNASTRLAGAIAMGSVARDWRDNRQECVDVLCGYLKVRPSPELLQEEERHGRASYRWQGAEDSVRAAVIDQLRRTVEQSTAEALPLDIGLSRAWLPPSTKFRSIHFLGPVDLGSATFTGSADFTDTHFSSRARFVSTQFMSDARFTETTFKGDVDFSGASFAGTRTWFARATFGSLATFVASVFVNDVHFGKAEFSNLVSFEGASFGRNLTLSKAVFGSSALFIAADFRGPVHMEGTVWRSDVNFRESTFASGGDFRGSRFASRADFGGVTFVARTDRFWGEQGQFQFGPLTADSELPHPTGCLSAENAPLENAPWKRSPTRTI